MKHGRTTDGPSDDPELRAMQKKASRLDMLWQAQGGFTNPESCLWIRKRHDKIVKELQARIKLPPRRVYNLQNNS